MSSRLDDAVSRAEAHLSSLGTIESVLADIRGGSAEPALVQLVIQEIEAGQREDGSWLGSLLETSLTLLLLHELGPTRTIVIDRAIEWLFLRCDAPGRFAKSWFSPAPAAVDLSSMTLPGGATIGTDQDARIAASCLACAAVITWGEHGPGMQTHVDEVDRLTHLAINGRFELSLSALLCATRLLCVADNAAAKRTSSGTRAKALECIARSQRADGSWRGADLFLVLDVLGISCRMGMAPPSVIVALRHAAVMLFLMQQTDGSWGRQTGPVQMLSGLSALRSLQYEAQPVQRLPQRTPTESSPPIIL